MFVPSEDPVADVRRINRTWFVWGHLADDTDRYLDELARRDPQELRAACARAVAAARQASKEKRDPKPDFYAALFLEATLQEREIYLATHPWTRRMAEQ